MGFDLRPDADGLRALTNLSGMLRGDNVPWESQVTILLLHDPEKHLLLDEQIRWQFSIYDRLSKAHLYFFVMNGSGERYALGKSSRDSRTQVIGDLARPSRNEPPSGFDGTEFWNLGLTQLFNLEPEHLPGMIVFLSHDGEAGRKKQATFIQLPLDNPTEFDRLFRLVLHQARSFSADECSPTDFHYAMAREGWTIQLPGGAARRASPLWDESKGGPPWGSSELPPAWMLQQAPALSLLGPLPDPYSRHNHAVIEELQPWIRHADEATRTVFSTALALWRVFHAGGPFGGHEWGPAIGQFAKGFERFIAMSVIQQARAFHGIEMPRWYGLHKPGHVAEVHNEDLNQPVGTGTVPLSGRDRPWKSTMLRQSREIYEGCSNAGHIPPLCEGSGQQGLLETWAKVASLRNPVAHTSLGRRAEADDMLEALSYLSTLGVPQRLGAIHGEVAPPGEEAFFGSSLGHTLVFEVPEGTVQPEVRSHLEISWRSVPVDAPLRLLLALRPGGSCIDLEPIEIEIRRPIRPDELNLALMKVAVETLRFVRDPALNRKLAPFGERYADSGRKERGYQAYRRKQALDLLEGARQELQSSIDNQAGIAEVVAGHKEILDLLRPRLGTPRDFFRKHHFRLVAQAGEQSPPEQAWQIQRTTVLRRIWVTKTRDLIPSAALEALVHSTEEGGRSPAAALEEAFTLLGLGHPDEDLSSEVHLEVRRLCGALRYWSRSIAELQQKYGEETPLAAPYMLLKELECLRDQPDGELLQAIDALLPADRPVFEKESTDSIQSEASWLYASRISAVIPVL